MNSSNPTPNEGIDKISVRIQSEFVNKARWFNYDPKNLINLRIRSALIFTLEIHAEKINLGIEILDQLAHILLELAHKNILLLKVPNNPADALSFIRQNIHRIAFLEEIEFFFDFTLSEVNLANIPDAQFTSTRYSNDHRRKRYSGDYQTKSILNCYDRRPRLIKLNQIPHTNILDIQNPIRVEFRLTRHNFRYMHLENLSGPYCEIITRYISFLGKMWRKYHTQVAELSDLSSISQTHPFFLYVMSIASENRIPNNDQLQQTNSMPSERNNYTTDGLDSSFFIRNFCSSSNGFPKKEFLFADKQY